MTNDKLLAIEVLEALPARKWEGTVYRVMLGDYPPDRANRVGARWNPPDIEAIYTSLVPETAIAEVKYHITLQPRPIKPALKLTLYEIAVELGAVVNLAEAVEALRAAGISQHDLFGSDMASSQAVGKTVTWLDRDGLLVQSARGTSLNLVIYPQWTRPGAFRFEVKSKQLV